MKKYMAEMVGTFVLVFGGVGSAVFAGEKIGLLGIAFAFGISLLAMVYTIGPVSGCHINPAVTAGMLLTRKIKAADAVAYVIAQIIGAVIASGLIFLIAGGGPSAHNPALVSNGYGIHSPGQYSLSAGLLTEVVLSMFLVLTVLGSTDVKAPVGFAGIAIGFVLVLIHLAGIPITNASVNPARSIGTAVFAGSWALQQLWLFIVAPLLGAGIAAGIYRAIRIPGELITTREAERALPAEQVERTKSPKAA
ncbi:MAG TPA: aquaporin Z [Terriglobales bacterium]|nr:aquaporin Z [Terriglobales bacterium]